MKDWRSILAKAKELKGSAEVEEAAYKLGCYFDRLRFDEAQFEYAQACGSPVVTVNGRFYYNIPSDAAIKFRRAHEAYLEALNKAYRRKMFWQRAPWFVLWAVLCALIALELVIFFYMMAHDLGAFG